MNEGCPLSWTATRLEDGGGRGPAVRLSVDGRDVVAFAGETVATALLAAGVRAFRETANARAPRGLFCGMGVCFDCVVELDGGRSVRACLTPVAEGMRIVTRRT